MEIAGRVLTQDMQKLLLETVESFTSSAEQEIVRSIKEQCCFVAQNWESEKAEASSSSTNDMDFTLPDKSVINVPASVRMSCPGLLFQPSLNGKTCASI